jgi:DICT domain-containing protein
MPLSITRPFLTPPGDPLTATSTSALIAISHALEDLVLEGLEDVEIAVGFQRMSAFRRQERRYRAIAAACRQVWVCAVPDGDTPPIPGITMVPLAPEWPVADEWFVVVNAPEFASALLASELTAGLNAQERSFHTMFTSDPRLVNAICRTLAIELDLHMELPARRDLAAQQANLRRFNDLALAYQQRPISRPRPPLSGLPRWTPPVEFARAVG